MDNNWDSGMQEDYDNMTRELGRECYVYPRNFIESYEGQESSSSYLGTAVSEIVFLQELDSEHELDSSGQFNVGDVRFTFLSDSIVEEESLISPDKGETYYKVLKLTKVKGMTNDKIVSIKGFGKKLPNR